MNFQNNVHIGVHKQRSGTPAQPEPLTDVPREFGALRVSRRLRRAGGLLLGVGALPRLQQPGGAHGDHQTAHRQGWSRRDDK